MPAPIDPAARAKWLEANRAAHLGKRRGPTSPEVKEKQRLGNLGKHQVSEETRQRLRTSHLGISPSERNLEVLRSQVGDKSPSWKGDGIGYSAAHGRARKRWSGAPCAGCGDEGRVQTALRHDATLVLVQGGRRYSPRPDDYAPLCGPCHNAYDRATRPAYIDTQERVRTIIENLGH